MDKPRILVIDDVKSLREGAKSILKEEFEVMACEDGLQALSVLNEFRPDLICVDIVMPRLDGYETVSLIRLNDAWRKVPIVMMSAKGGVFDVARARLLGFNGHVFKPFQMDSLRAIIKEHLKLGPASAGRAS